MRFRQLRSRREAAVGHAQWLQELALDQFGKRQPSGCVPAHGRPWPRPRWSSWWWSPERKPGSVWLRLFTVSASVGPRVVEIVAHRRLAHQSRTMADHLPQGNALLERVLRPKFGQVALYRHVEIDEPHLDQHHEQQAGKRLGNGADAIDRVAGGRRLSLTGRRKRSPATRRRSGRQPERWTGREDS